MTAATSVKHGTHAALSALESAGTTVVYDTNKRSTSSQFPTDGHAEFLAMVLHELRNPLSAILSGVSCARHNRVVSSDLEWIWGSLERASERVRALAGDLTQLCHSAHPAFELRHRPVNLSSLVRSILESRRDTIEHSTIKVGLRVSNEAIWVNGDALRLQIALENLLDNALKYTGAGGDITVSVISSGEEAILRFRDRGRGISPEVLPTYLSPLYAMKMRKSLRRKGPVLG
jgi:signal transduction histidine kinase